MDYAVGITQNPQIARKVLNALLEDIDRRLPVEGTGSPEGVVTAGVGKLYVRTDGGTATTLYVKEAGSGNTGWAAK